MNAVTAEASASAAQRLKAATTTLHRQLDQHPLIRALLKPGFDTVRHIALLRAFRRAYAQCEPAILHYERAHIISAPVYQARLPCLARVLGEAVEPAKELATVKSLSTAQYWGCRYVLDGSCHGAQILLPRLRVQLGDNDDSLAYWHLLAKQSSVWPAVTTALNAFYDGQTLRAECVAAARDTFQRFIAALQASPVYPED